MKQVLKITIICAVVFIGGQSHIPLKTAANHIDKKQEKTLSDIVVSSEDQLESVVVTEETKESYFDAQLLTLASKGKLKNVDYPIGTNITEIITAQGEPDEQGTWGGADYYVFDNVMFFVPFGQEKVSSIEVYLSSKDLPLLRDVEQLIGKSTSGIEQSELDGSSFLLYNFERYALYIEAPNENERVEMMFLKEH